MKKILFSLIALVCSMSMNAQVMKIMKNGQDTPEETYYGSDYYVVFEEVGKTGTAKATIDGSKVDVNWVQLWEDGPKFAEFNVGVTDGKAESCGGYYAWGGNLDKGDDHNTGNANLTGDNDTATKLWGSAWRMPTKAELDDLLAKCDVTWTDNYKETGVKGRIYTGKGDYASNSIFLPAAGYYNGSVRQNNTWGYYWSSTPNNSNTAHTLSFKWNSQDVTYSYRNGNGDPLSVRAVLAE